jgi:transposase InsO family protein
MEKDLLAMSQRERDVLKVMSLVLEQKRTQREAGRLLAKSERQIRRIQRRLESEGDRAVIHRLRGQPSNRRVDEPLRTSALELCRRKYAGFGPTLAAEKLAEEEKIVVAVRTLGRWLLEAGLWKRKRRRDKHRRRRERKECFGEMVQADASEHDWLEGRGGRMVLMGMIDDATSRVMARFYPAERTEAYMDLLKGWIRKHGRPVSWYSDRDSVFVAKDEEGNAGNTQFSRALEELNIQLISANSPQAKGRVERLWGTAQDRLVKELRLAGARTMEQANAVLEAKFEPWFNRRCTVKPASANDAHRALGPSHKLEAILSIQERRTVANDYTIRYENKTYQLLPPAWPGERGGTVIVEQRLDGTMHVRLKKRYLAYRALSASERMSLMLEPIPVMELKDPAAKATGSITVHRSDRRSGRTPALPYPPISRSSGRGKEAYRPEPSHPWRGAVVQ